MNTKITSFILFVVLLAGCTPSPEKQAIELMQKSIEAHETSNSWAKPESDQV